MSSFAVTLTVLAGLARAEQPVLPPPPAPTAQPVPTPPPGPAPEGGPAAPTQAPAPTVPPAPEGGPAAPTQAPAPAEQPAAQPQPQQGPPLTSQYPPLPPMRSEPAAVPAMPRGTAPPGATPMMLAPPAPKQVKYYPVTVMVADALWIVAATQQTEEPLLFLGGYIGAAPLAHLLMGNPRSALISGGLRAGAVAFTTAATIHAFTSDCYECDTEIGLVAVGLIGAATIMVADWIVLAKKEVPAPVQPRSAPDWAVTPQVQVGQGGMQLGLGGWF